MLGTPEIPYSRLFQEIKRFWTKKKPDSRVIQRACAAPERLPWQQLQLLSLITPSFSGWAATGSRHVKWPIMQLPTLQRAGQEGHSSWGGHWSQSPEHGRGQPWDSWEGVGLHVFFICIKEHRKERSNLHKQIQELQLRLKSLLLGPHQVMERRLATAHLINESDMV